MKRREMLAGGAAAAAVSAGMLGETNAAERVPGLGLIFTPSNRDLPE